MFKEEDLNRLSRFLTLEMIHRERRDGGGLLGDGLIFLHPSQELHRLQILLDIEKNPRITQKLLAKGTGLAPSMINNYLREMVIDGTVEMRGRTRRSITYHLTQKGVEKKRSLLSSYTMEMLRLYKNVKDKFYKRLLTFHDDGIRRVVLYGAGELSMLLLGSLDDAGLKLLGIVDTDPEKQGNTLFGIKIKSPQEIVKLRPDAVIITSLFHREEIHKGISYLERDGIRIREF